MRLERDKKRLKNTTKEEDEQEKVFKKGQKT